jgi:hypothetical protein
VVWGVDVVVVVVVVVVGGGCGCGLWLFVSEEFILGLLEFGETFLTLSIPLYRHHGEQEREERESPQRVSTDYVHVVSEICVGCWWRRCDQHTKAAISAIFLTTLI